VCAFIVMELLRITPYQTLQIPYALQ